MATKITATKLTDAEVKYQHKVKSIELAIKACVGNRGANISTVIKAAEEIYKYFSA